MSFRSVSHSSAVHLLVHSRILWIPYPYSVSSQSGGGWVGGVEYLGRVKKQKTQRCCPSLSSHLNYEVDCVGHSRVNPGTPVSNREDETKGRKLPFLRARLSIVTPPFQAYWHLAISRALPSCFCLRAFALTIPSAIMLFLKIATWFTPLAKSCDLIISTLTDHPV